MNKFAKKSIPAVILLIFVLIMLSGNYLKKTYVKGQNMPGVFEKIVKDISEDNWDEAYRNTEEMHNIWKKIINRVQYSSERDEINALSVNIARLRGAIWSRDKASALIEINEAYNHWLNLGR